MREKDQQRPPGVLRAAARARGRRLTQREAAQRHGELVEEHGVLLREFAAVQQRCTALVAEQSRCLERQAAQLLRLRGELIARDTLVAVLRDEIAALRCGQALAGAELESLRDKAVLCVAGRTAGVPAYRRLVEGTGGRFLHHDGGERDRPAQLEASLAEADLVICQTGCLSHDACWRVEDHCRRHGKRCVFLDTPSAASLSRQLRAAPVPPRLRATSAGKP